MKPVNVLMGCPSTDGWSMNSAAQLNAYNSKQSGRLFRCDARSSIVTYGFNQLWATALNGRSEYGFTHFLLMHADVKPVDPDWLDVMLKEMAANQADVLSVIIPIKDDRGLTSTAFDCGGWKCVRLTQTQMWSTEFPDTWTADNLLFNTGLMLIDLSKPWVDEVFFTINDRIVKKDGRFYAEVESEDWNFSRQCNKLGVRSFVTRKIRIEHYGQASFPNDKIWGQELDIVNPPTEFQVTETV